MESVTAWAWGPLSFLTFLAFLCRHPSRFVLQLIISLGTWGHPDGLLPLCLLPNVTHLPPPPRLGQLYGDVLYFATEARVGWTHSDPHPLYFWVYFVGLNGIWVVVPAALIADACKHLSAAQRAHDSPRQKAH